LVLAPGIRFSLPSLFLLMQCNWWAFPRFESRCLRLLLLRRDHLRSNPCGSGPRARVTEHVWSPHRVPREPSLHRRGTPLHCGLCLCPCLRMLNVDRAAGHAECLLRA
jgi:hypothetical protein